MDIDECAGKLDVKPGTTFKGMGAGTNPLRLCCLRVLPGLPQALSRYARCRLAQLRRPILVVREPFQYERY